MFQSNLRTSFFFIIAAAMATAALAMHLFAPSIAAPVSVVMTLAALLGSLYIFGVACDRAVNRQTARLEKDIVNFRKDPRAGSSFASNTPLEIAFGGLAEDLTCCEERSATQQTTALDLQRELLHRVNNNFQVIQSMIHLAAREAKGADISELMAERVQMLSVVHKAQHDLETAEIRRMASALPALVTSLRASGLMRQLKLTLEVDEIDMPIPQTGALLHLTVEGLKRFSDAGAARVRIHATPGAIRLLGDTPPTASDTLSQRLTAAYAREIGGTFETDNTTIAIRF
ncbi:histidine kinase dimerization/phosphoacceptor domain -containing protein [Paracoccaceae bacterium GXU_MW_L88]